MVRRHRLVSYLLLSLAALACVAFVIVSNDADWDQFLAAAEADVRSWRLDHRPPTWSNQLCGGVTREGDPQAFGLSPLFVVPVVLGTFWGLKALALLGLLAGAWGTSGLFSLIITGGRATSAPSSRQRAVIALISFGFIGGDAFLWHLHLGHVSFLLHGLVVALLRGLAGAVCVGVTRRRLAGLAVGSWALLSAGFYASLLFFAVPLSLAVAVTAALRARHLGRDALRAATKNALAALLALGAGALAASYKWLEVLAYQQLHPRTVEVTAGDGLLPWELVAVQLQPVFHGRFALFDVPRVWGIWEYGGFSLGAWWCVALLVVALVSRSRVRRAPWALPVCLAVVSAFFALGTRAPWSGHQLLNALLGNSVRVAARYQAVLALAWPLFIAVAWRARADLRRFVLWSAPLLPVLWLVNLALFPLPPTWARAQAWLSSPPVELREMREVAVVPERARGQSYTWPAMRAGLAVSNCYDPLWRVSVFTSEHTGRPELLDANGKLKVATYGFIDASVGAPDEACLRESSFSQQDVKLAPSCRRGTCVNLNDPRGGGLVFDETVRKFCLP